MTLRPHAAPLAVWLFLWPVAACNSLLESDNLDSADVATTLGTPSGLAAVTATLFQTIWTTSSGNLGGGAPVPIYQALQNMSFENFSVQYGPAAAMAALPRVAIANTRSDNGGATRLRDFSGLSRNSRTAANVVIGLDKLVAAKRTLGTPALNARARSFAFFANGVSLGNLALVYDSAAIVTPAVPENVIPPLSGAAEVMRAALASLDSAITIAKAPSVAEAFPLPATWINGRALSVAEYERLVRSYRARFRAGVARTREERAAVDWTAVIADVNAGYQTDFNVSLDGAAGWAGFLLAGQYQQSSVIGYQMTPMILGMADTSGAFDAWLSRPLDERRPFLIRSPDRRLPAGETRAIQIANSPSSAPSLLYFKNRNVTLDVAFESWGTSYYEHYRWRALFTASFRGDFPLITKAELDLLAAEGYVRQGEIASAAARIDIYRTRAGLPALAGVVTNSSMPVPGGRACVPRVPTSTGTSTTCGTIFEALKWEKRMETAFTGWAPWYFDSRGWGDLPEGTPLEFPVPYQELEARNKPLYNLGGIGGKSAAPKGTYGL